MKTSLFRVVVSLVCFSGGASAQLAGTAASVLRVQNWDVSLLCTTEGLKAQVLDNSVTIYGNTWVSCLSQVIGYQFAHISAATLWVELAPEFRAGGSTYGSAPGPVDRQMDAHTLGLRFLAPIGRRISIYATAGGGAASFHDPYLIQGSVPVLLNNSTFHGVFEFGGGVDIRLWRRFSIRGEVRDFVTGHDLSGIVGSSHVLPAIGVAFHY